MNFTNWRICPENQKNQNEQSFTLCWVFVDRFEEAWSKDMDYYKSGENNKLKASFFDLNQSYFMCGRAYYYAEEDRIRFSGGRHRSRWYIDTFKPILFPLGLSQRNIISAKKAGLVLREIASSETIDLPIRISDIEKEHEEYTSYDEK